MPIGDRAGLAASNVYRSQLIRQQRDEIANLEQQLVDYTSATSEATQITNAFSSALGQTAIVAAAVNVVRLSDQLVQFRNRLQLVTDTTSEVIRTQDRLFDVANRTRTAFETTGQVYTRTALSIRDQDGNLQRSRRELEQFIVTLNQATILSGPQPQEARFALIQLGQGIASNRLSGDELRSVLEQLPFVADIIAESLDATRGELRELARSGIVTADVILDAFRDRAHEINAIFESTTTTVGQQWDILVNRFQEFVGSFGNTSRVLANIVEAIGNNIGVIASGIGAIGVTLAGALSVAAIRGTIGLLIGAFAALTTPIGAVIAAGTAFVTGLTIMLNATDELDESIKTISLDADGFATSLTDAGAAAIQAKRNLEELDGAINNLDPNFERFIPDLANPADVAYFAYQPPTGLDDVSQLLGNEERERRIFRAGILFAQGRINTLGVTPSSSFRGTPQPTIDLDVGPSLPPLQTGLVQPGRYPGQLPGPAGFVSQFTGEEQVDRLAQLSILRTEANEAVADLIEDDSITLSEFVRQFNEIRNRDLIDREYREAFEARFAFLRGGSPSTRLSTGEVDLRFILGDEETASEIQARHERNRLFIPVDEPFGFRRSETQTGFGNRNVDANQYLRDISGVTELRAIADSINEDFIDAADSFSEALVDHLQGDGDIGEAFRDLAEDFARDLAQTLIQDIARDALRTTGRTFFRDLFGVGASAFSGVIANQRGGIVDRTTAFHTADGNLNIAGEAGPEAILPLTRDSEGNLGLAGGGAPSVTINIAQDSPLSRRQVDQVLTAWESRYNGPTQERLVTRGY